MIGEIRMQMEDGSSTVRPEIEKSVTAFHEHLFDGPSSDLVALIDEEAVMTLLVGYGEPLRGRATIVDAVEHGRAAELYRARVTGCVQLDERTLLVAGQARYALERGGFAVGRVFWLDELRQGRLWRVRAFRTEAEARRTYAEANASVLRRSQFTGHLGGLLLDHASAA